MSEMLKENTTLTSLDLSREGGRGMERREGIKTQSII